MTPHRRVLVSVVLVLAVFLVGSLGFLYFEEDCPSIGDAAYMTVITLSTVGFGEVWPLSTTGRIWTAGVITFGIATVSYAFTSLIALFVSGELRSTLERKRMEESIRKVRDHTVICGYGRIGAMVAAELTRSGLEVVVVERDREIEGVLRDADIPHIIGDATDEEVLQRTGASAARAIVVAVPSDADNVYIALTVRTLFPKLTIIARAEHPATEAKLIRAGATRVVCPKIISATKIANILMRPSVVDFVEVANRGVDLEIDEYTIRIESSLIGRTLRDAHVRQSADAQVVAIKRADGAALMNPDPTALLAAGDTLILVGRSGVSDRLDNIETGA